MSTTVDGTGAPAPRVGFGATLRYWRKRAGLTQLRLAAELGYHNSVISRWESGGKLPPPEHVRHIDAIVGADGALTQLRSDIAGGKRDRAALPGLGPHVPLPGAPHDAPGTLAVGDTTGWPSNLPHHGTDCPLHPGAVCPVPPTEQATAVYGAFANRSEQHIDDDTIHVLTAQQAHYACINEQRGPDGLHTAVERTLHLIAATLRTANLRYGQALLHLAATYAGLAGQLRMLRGHQGAAMALYGKALHWSVLCDDVPLRASVLCDMSCLARLEDDGASAISYAQAVSSIGPGRTWTTALSHLYVARGFAILGDLRETTRSVASVRGALEELTEHDEQEMPPWIAGVRGHVFIEAGVGGALRDAAAATADRGIAHAAVKATEHSLTLVPAKERPATALLTLRLADCYACAGQPEASVAITTPVLADAMTLPMATVVHELRGLRSRLAARWSSLAPVRNLLDQGR